MLAKHKRDQYRLSTTVGRIILDEIDTQARNFGEKGDLFKFGRPNKIVYDYTEKGAMWDTHSPLCVGLVLDRPMFSLVRALPSPTSAEDCSPLFGWLIGTTTRSDPR